MRRNYYKSFTRNTTLVSRWRLHQLHKLRHWPYYAREVIFGACLPRFVFTRVLRLSRRWRGTFVAECTRRRASVGAVACCRCVLYVECVRVSRIKMWDVVGCGQKRKLCKRTGKKLTGKVGSFANATSSSLQTSLTCYRSCEIFITIL